MRTHVAVKTFNIFLVRISSRCTTDTTWRRVIDSRGANTTQRPFSGEPDHKSSVKRRIYFTCAEDVATSIAPGSELSIVAISAIDLLHFRSELFIHQRDATFAAQETRLVPVFVFVRQVLYKSRVNTLYEKRVKRINISLLCCVCIHDNVSVECH